jgi:hypothetical protein
MRGVNYYWFAWPQRDLEGNCRLAGAWVDMGCHEYDAFHLDGDPLSDFNEAESSTDPDLEDTDGDGLRDSMEILRGSDPLTPTPPTTVYVPSDILTIQDSLCLAADGDEIVVAPGIYHENIHFCGPDVVLRGSDPQNTVPDGGGAGPVTSFTGYETEACILTGFTITGGSAGYGGGIYGGRWDDRTHATIQNNVITGNSAANYGGGLFNFDGIILNRTYYFLSGRNGPIRKLSAR